jgi:hypothetical protein
MCPGVFIVENVEGRHPDAGDFFRTESDYGCRVLRRRMVPPPRDCQCRYGFRPTLSLRSLYGMRHSEGPAIQPRLLPCEGFQFFDNRGRKAGFHN